MPAHERVGLHHRQELALVDEWREENERNSRGVVRAPRPDLPLDLAGELLPEEQILGRQLRAGPGHQPQELHQVSSEEASAVRSTSGDNNVAATTACLAVDRWPH